MTLIELSSCYEESAQLLRVRIRELQRMQPESPEEAQRLAQRIAQLEPLLREMRELAVLTAHYYDRSYRKNGKYTL